MDLKGHPVSNLERVEATLRAVDAPAPDSDHKPDHPPQLEASSWKYALKRTVREFGTDGGADLAAMLTFFSVLSLAPALLAVFSLITLVLASNAETVTSLVDDLVRQYVPTEYQSLVVMLVETMISSSSGGVVALIIGIAIAVWSSSAYVKAFSRSMNIIYGREEGRGLIKRTAAMLGTTLAILVGAVLILVCLALNDALVTGVLGPIAGPLGLGELLGFMTESFLPVWAWAKWPIILVLVIAIVALLYYFTPNVRQPRFTWVSLGSVVAIIGIAIAGAGLYLYSSYFAGYNPYGAIGTVMALLLALWVSNIVLLLGAEVDAEVERARQLQAGMPAERHIQLPPWDTAKVKTMKTIQTRLESQGRALRMAHREHPTADRSTSSDRSDPIDPNNRGHGPSRTG
jgi:membrane protein